ncbi:substrate-binding domain-containing protein [Clavibacter zhangzhiyongii]|uniref:substrate-binding domain-containing protein n=1 Tax=Clavibacter zhangzhiyongii TaxID=2768071 RepID=UPI0039DFE1BF
MTRSAPRPSSASGPQPRATRLPPQPRAGRSLRRGRSGAIALFVPIDTARTSLGETFYFPLASGLHEALQEQHLDVLMIPAWNDEDAAGQVSGLVARGIADAYVLTNTSIGDPRVDALAEAGAPFVTLGQTGRDDHPALDLDFDGAAAGAVAALAAVGHRDIAVACDDRPIAANDLFLAAWERTMREHGLDAGTVIRVPDRADAGVDLSRRLLRLTRRPTAVVLAQETLALGLYPELAAAGVRIGTDVALVGFRDNPVCAPLRPTLPAFGLDVRGLGHRLGRTLLECMSQEGTAGLELWPMGRLTTPLPPPGSRLGSG